MLNDKKGPSNITGMQEVIEGNIVLDKKVKGDLRDDDMEKKTWRKWGSKGVWPLEGSGSRGECGAELGAHLNITREGPVGRVENAFGVVGEPGQRGWGKGLWLSLWWNGEYPMIWGKNSKNPPSSWRDWSSFCVEDRLSGEEAGSGWPSRRLFSTPATYATQVPMAFT